MIKTTENGILIYRSELFLQYNIPHAFTTRRGGVSSGDFDSLNISTRRCDTNGETDRYENTVENFTRVLSLVNAVPEKSVCAHQVHGNTVLELDESFGGMGILRGVNKNIDADGLYVGSTNVGIDAICVKSADCTPVLFADKRTGSVCAVHSGWRGTMQDIPGEAVRTMQKNGSDLQDILCCIGPCIGVCCYEVSSDVYDCAQKTLSSKNADHLLGELFTDKKETDNGTKYHFNIGRMCRELVRLCGVPEQNICLSDLCTCCKTDENGRIFFSHRGQNGHSGTFASVISPF